MCVYLEVCHHTHAKGTDATQHKAQSVELQQLLFSLISESLHLLITHIHSGNAYTHTHRISDTFLFFKSDTTEKNNSKKEFVFYPEMLRH